MAEGDRPERATGEDARPALTIRDARPGDWDGIWHFFRQIVAAGETYGYEWQSLGFKILAGVPEAFDHPRHGYVALLIMHRFV